MAQSTLTYILSHIRQNIPNELLQLAFKPRQFTTNIEQRINQEVMQAVLLDINLVGGKRKEIFMNQSWRMNIRPAESDELLGSGMQGSYYIVPPEAREFRNIASVIGTSPFLGDSMTGAGVTVNGLGGGNTVSNMLTNMVNTRTMSQYPLDPQVTLEGTNIICFYPDLFIDAVAVSVMLEYDEEFLAMPPSGILALQALALCAVQRYIATKLRVAVDETEVVAGMEIGVVKTLIDEYAQKGEAYRENLLRVRGALMYDKRTLNRLIRYAL